MLSTNKKAQLHLDNEGIHTVNRVDNSILRHNIYFTSDDDIKEGDWYYDIYDECIYPCMEIPPFEGTFKKIIATTDTSLSIKIREDDGFRARNKSLPKPSESFIKKYVEEYNKGNQIVDVLVEYEYRHGNSVPYPKTLDGEAVLKVNPKDNTINIKQAKNSWTQEEVEELCRKSYQQGEIWASPDQSAIPIEKWIKEILN